MCHLALFVIGQSHKSVPVSHLVERLVLPVVSPSEPSRLPPLARYGKERGAVEKTGFTPKEAPQRCRGFRGTLVA